MPSHGDPWLRRLGRLTRRLAWSALLIALAYGGYETARAAQHFIYQSHYFTIQDVRILGASPALEAQARERADTLLARVDRNLMRVDHRRLAERLTELPRARAAQVRKGYPHGLTIEFQEREPLMIVNLNHPFLIDREGVVLDMAEPGALRALGLPVLTGVRNLGYEPGDTIEIGRLNEVLAAVQFVQENDPAVHARITEWNINGREEVTAIFRSGTQVLIGRKAPLALLDKLSAALAQNPDELDQAQYIDLRMDRQVVYNMGETR